MSRNDQRKEPSELRIISSYISRAHESLMALSQDRIIDLLGLLSEARASRATVFVAGNGGSASTADHISLDWMLGTSLSNPPLRVINLAQSSASITATGNDLTFDDVFSRQLKSLSRNEDLLLVISASGNSPNLLNLVREAKALGLRTIAMTGFDGGRLSEMADLSVHVPTALGDYGVAEDLHLMIGHIVKEALIAGEEIGD